MLESYATVVETEGRLALVKPHQQTGCSRCNGQGCGSAKLSQLFCSKQRLFKVENRIDAQPGDRVVIATEDGNVLRSIVLVYLVPLLGLSAGAIAGSRMGAEGGQQDFYAALVGLLGLSLGFLISRKANRNLYRQNLPFILQKA